MSFARFGSSFRNHGFSLNLRRVFINSIPPVRKVFLILRHGESKWNEAQSKSDLVALIDYDHPLSELGLHQAMAFNKTYKSSLEGLHANRGAPDDSTLPYLQCLDSATHVYSSPLTRAVQTALVALKGHSGLVDNGLQLYSVIREAKGVGGLDTVGIRCGDDIAARVTFELDKALGNEEAASLLSCGISVNDCNLPWWNSQSEYEAEEDVQMRIREFLRFVRFNDVESPIFVGHSLFFRSMYSTRVGDALRSNKPLLAADMMEHKLGNASMLGVTVVYPGVGEPYIEDAELLFNSEFQKSKSSK